jgi:hypothetical protein
VAVYALYDVKVESLGDRNYRVFLLSHGAKLLSSLLSEETGNPSSLRPAHSNVNR